MNFVLKSINLMPLPLRYQKTIMMRLGLLSNGINKGFSHTAPHKMFMHMYSGKTKMLPYNSGNVLCNKITRITGYQSMSHDAVDNSAKNTKGSSQLKETRKLVESLSTEEQMLLLVDLQQLQADDIKRRAEEKLASWRWRSKFGRPSSIHPVTADPTGTFCEVPAEWLQDKVAEQTKVEPPTVKELRQIAVFNALPFVGFGFLDNLIMIVAGDYIDLTIGTYFMISTMAAAALGNTISDLAGIGSAWYVESLTAKVGIHAPRLTPAQLSLPSTRWSANIGRSVGVVVGCLLGMVSLLFLPEHARTVRHKETDKDKKQ